MRILASLMEDGRASFRQIAKRTSLTTPTVSARVARMVRAGLIKKFIPILSPDSLSSGVTALVTLKVGADSLEKVARQLARLPAVEDVYATTRQDLSLKVGLEKAQDLEPFLNQRFLKRPGINVTSSQIITLFGKEKPAPLALSPAIVMNLRCDYCHGEVMSNRPYTMAVGSSHYYFCCKTCKKGYLDKYGKRLAKLRGRARSATLRS
jgi:DNA-binding Lrp family transcriptional regulator